ncbi:MAG: methylmalonyl-CoA epimerase [candidate division WOR-3 bacterium]|nr:MAG: methylmalonyl-CoA epimerase [candidate division WOR-3 bacterium]
MKLEHIGIAVKDIENQLRIWRDLLGFSLKMISETPEQKVRVAMLDVGGVTVELLEPTSEDSTIHKFIEKRGEGLHHLSFEVEDIKKSMEDLKNRGAILIDEIPRKGAHAAKIAFVHPRSTGGVLIELSQREERD